MRVIHERFDGGLLVERLIHEYPMPEPPDAGVLTEPQADEVVVADGNVVQGPWQPREADLEALKDRLP